MQLFDPLLRSINLEVVVWLCKTIAHSCIASFTGKESFEVYTRTYPEFVCLGFVPVAQIQTIAWPWSYMIFPRHIFVLSDFCIHRYLFRLKFFLILPPFFSSACWKAVMQSIIISYSPNHGVIVGPTNCSLLLLHSRSCFEPSCE